MNKKNTIKHNIESNIVKQIEDNLNIYSEIKNCEYIYIDKIDIEQTQNTLLNNKILLTKKLNQYFMIENTTNKEIELTKLNYKHIADLLIINKQNQTPDLNEIIDQDTIIIKNLGRNIIYLEDQRKQNTIILTPYEKIMIKQNGINTQLKYYEILN